MKFLSRHSRFLVAICMVSILCSTQRLGAQQSASASQSPAVSPAKLQFLVKLIAPRPTFATDMTAQEQAVMERHAAYWAGLFKAGKVLLVGPVLDPKGPFGIGVVEVASQAEAQQIADNDPSVLAGINKVEVTPMHVFLSK